MSRRRRTPHRPITKANRPGTAVAVQPQATFTADQVAALALASQKPTTAMARPLPRLEPPAVPFGPGVPLQPASINQQRDDGRAYPRQFEYPVSWNLPGFSDRLIPWAILRGAADIPLFRQCIETRKNEVATRDWDIVVSAKAIERAQREAPDTDRKTIEKQLQEKVNPHIGRLVEFWEEPDPREGLDFASWATKFLEEYFALDAVPIYPRLTLGGDLYGFEILDGTTIKPLLDQYGRRPLPPSPAYQQILYGFPRGEFVADTVTDPDGQDIVLDGYDRDQLVYLRTHVRTFTPYGHSAVERALEDGDLWMRRHGWLRAEYTDGVMPSGWLEAGEGQADWSPQQLSEYERAFNDYYAGATSTRQRFRILPFGMKPSQSTDVGEKYKPEYDLFLLKLVIRHFDTTMAELGFTEPGGLGSAGWHEGQADVQERTANRPTLMRLQALCTRLMRRYLDCPPELEFRFMGLQSEDEANEDGIWAQRVKDGRATLNEDRDRTGLPRYNFPAADMPALMSPRGLVFLEGAEKLAQPGQMVGPPMPQPEGGRGEGSGGEAGEHDGGAGLDAAPAGGKAGPPAGAQPVEKVDRAELAAAKRAELAAYRRWRAKRGDRPARPFVLQVLTKADFVDAGLPVPGDVVFKADDSAPSTEDSGQPPVDQWPGWAVDAQIAAGVAALIAAAMPAAVDPAALARTFLAQRAPSADAPTVDEVIDWLDHTQVLSRITGAIAGPLEQAYTEGYAAGGRASTSLLTGGPVDFTGWHPGDIDAARQLLSADGKTQLLSQLLAQWDVTIKSVANTRYHELAKVLADGLANKQTLPQIEKALRGILDDRAWARMVAITETSRAMTAAALDEYERSGVAAVAWLTTPGACPLCLANEAAGPVGLGDKFPSGDYGPPGHPHCRCAIIPAAAIVKAQIADLTKNFDPAEARDDHGRWSKIGALVHALKQAGHGGAVALGDDHYADWSPQLPDGGRRFEFGDGTDAVNLDLSRADVDRLYGDLTSSLAETRPGGFVFGDGEHDHREVSWGPRGDDGDDWQLTAIDEDGEEVDLDLTYAQMEHLHHGLTIQQLLDAHDHGDTLKADQLLNALAKLDVAALAKFNPDELRVPGGQAGGGRWMSLVDRAAAAIEHHHGSGGKGDPLEGFNRDQLMRIARQRGVTLRRGASRDEVAKAVHEHLAAHTPEPKAPAKAAKATAKKAASAKASTKTPQEHVDAIRAIDDEDKRRAYVDGLKGKELDAVAREVPGVPKSGTVAVRRKAILDKLGAAPRTPDRTAAAHRLSAEPTKAADPAAAKRITALQRRIAAVREEAHPVAEAIGKFLESRSQHDTTEQNRRYDALKKLHKKADPVTRELLDELIKRDGEPWGGDPDADADRWTTPQAWDITTVRDDAPKPAANIRDRYVVTDSNTIKQNASLRSGEPTPAAKRWAADVRRWVRYTELTHDTLLHRGAALPAEVVAAMRPGAVIHDVGIMSTDMREAGADTYADIRLERNPGTLKTMFQLRVPKGTSAAFASYGEVVLDHGSRFRVVSSHMDDQGVVRVVMEYAGGDP